MFLKACYIRGNSHRGEIETSDILWGSFYLVSCPSRIYSVETVKNGNE